eukprot:31573-Chlamydomonas_euryale.AAC.1
MHALTIPLTHARGTLECVENGCIDTCSPHLRASTPACIHTCRARMRPNSAQSRERCAVGFAQTAVVAGPLRMRARVRRFTAGRAHGARAPVAGRLRRRDGP